MRFPQAKNFKNEFLNSLNILLGKIKINSDTFEKYIENNDFYNLAIMSDRVKNEEEKSLQTALE